MPSDKAELAARIAILQSGDSVRGLIFKSVFSLVQQHAGATGMEKIRKGELDHDYAELRSYPAKELLMLLFSVGDLLEGTLGSVEEVFQACGEVSITRYSTGPGMLIFGIISRGDPQKLFAGAQMAYSAAVSYGNREYLTTGTKSGTLRMRRDMMPPAYHVGILTGSLKVLGLTGKVTAKPQGIDRVDYDIHWS